jgi:hypothetical protein
MIVKRRNVAAVVSIVHDFDVIVMKDGKGGTGSWIDPKATAGRCIRGRHITRRKSGSVRSTIVDKVIERCNVASEPVAMTFFSVIDG